MRILGKMVAFARRLQLGRRLGRVLVGSSPPAAAANTVGAVPSTDHPLFGRYRKLWAALLSVAVIQVKNSLGWDLTGLEPVLEDVIWTVITGWLVWRVPNDPA